MVTYFTLTLRVHRFLLHNLIYFLFDSPDYFTPFPLQHLLLQHHSQVLLFLLSHYNFLLPQLLAYFLQFLLHSFQLFL